jgi:hypothetical protein
MPYYPPIAGPIIATNLGATLILGLAVPDFALGIALGVAKWLPQIAVATTDTGSLGVGKGVLPFAVPQPLLLAFLLESFASMGIIGVMAPLKVLGLANGLAATLPSALIQTTHPSVGVGAGIAKFTPVPAAPTIILGLGEVGMVGPGVVQVATAIGLGLTKAVAAFVIPVPIVGSASPSAGAGVGSGKVL